MYSELLQKTLEYLLVCQVFTGLSDISRQLGKPAIGLVKGLPHESDIFTVYFQEKSEKWSGIFVDMSPE